MFDKICLWSCQILNFCLLGAFNHGFNFRVCDWPVLSHYFRADLSFPSPPTKSLEPLVGKTELMHYNVKKVHKSRRPVLEMFSAGFLHACIYVKVQCVLKDKGKKEHILTDDLSKPCLDFVSCGHHLLATPTVPQTPPQARNALWVSPPSERSHETFKLRWHKAKKQLP